MKKLYLQTLKKAGHLPRSNRRNFYMVNVYMLWVESNSTKFYIENFLGHWGRVNNLGD